MNKEEDRLIQGDWGYAVIKDGAIWIPAVEGRLKPILQGLYERTGIKRMIFSAVLDPESLKSHLRNIVKEWDVWFEEAGDYSHCIEIDYQPAEVEEKAKEPMARDILAYCKGCGARFMAIIPGEQYCPTCIDEAGGKKA